MIQTEIDTLAYYTPIQYCPDKSRMETINIGIMLFIPQNSLNWQFDADLMRVRRMFPNAGNRRLLAEIKAFDHRLQTMKVPNKDNLSYFIDSRAGNIMCQPLRSMKISENATVENAMKELFKSLVIDPEVIKE